MRALGSNCCLKLLTYGAVLKAFACPQLFAPPQSGVDGDEDGDGDGVLFGAGEGIDSIFLH
jgi:hypothetical protein